MAPQPARCLVDPGDVGPNRFAALTPRQDEVLVVRLRALQVVHHEIAAVRLHARLEVLHGLEEIGEIARIFHVGDRDAAVPQPARYLRNRRVALLLAVRVEGAFQLFVFVTRFRSHDSLPWSSAPDALRVPRPVL